jgi:DHA1 family multidrug resistance protein-like MFS transporter
MIDWRRNLLFLCLSQLLSLMGFGFALPFAPLYLRELGVSSPEALRIWSGLFTAGAGVPMAIAAPVWGVLSDRWGRKPMTLRANLAGAVVLSCMGLVHTPGMLVALRVCQGIFTGTVTANLALVVSTTPEKKMGLAVGVMNSAVFAGNAFGPLIGGYLSDHFGFRVAFYLSGLLLLAAFLIALLGVKEHFPRGGLPAASPGRMLDFLTDHRLLAFVGLIALLGGSRYSPQPIYPLLVEEIANPRIGVSTQAGIVNAAAGVAAVLAGVVLGRLADAGRPYRLGIIASVAAALLFVPQGFARHIGGLLVLCFAAAFFAGGIEPILNVLLSRHVPVERRGAAFGLAGSARAVGWSVGGLIGGGLAAWLGFPAVFAFSALLCLAMAISLRRLEQAERPTPGATAGRATGAVTPPGVAPGR